MPGTTTQTHTPPPFCLMDKLTACQYTYMHLWFGYILYDTKPKIHFKTDMKTLLCDAHVFSLSKILASNEGETSTGKLFCVT